MRVGIPSIDTTDLSDIVKDVQRTRRWTPKTAAKAELWYRRFLALSYNQNRKPVFGICKLSDHIWHQHIMSTQRYRADCQRIFGRYLDHTPGKPPNWQTKLAAAEAKYQTTYRELLPFGAICCY
jgi:hypothetical protein